jgi:hypothetical protein
VRPYFGLGGRAAEAAISPDTRLLLQAEQLAREIVATRPDLVLTDVEMLQLPTGPVLIFSIQNPRQPSPEGIQQFEEMLRLRIPDPNVRVVVRVVDSRDLTTKGRILYGAAHFAARTPEEIDAQRLAEETVKRNIESIPTTFVTAIDAVPEEEGWRVRAETVGLRVPTPAELRAAEQASEKTLAAKVEILLQARTDLFVTSEGYSPVGTSR